jgi:hypothetical protein
MPAPEVCRPDLDHALYDPYCGGVKDSMRLTVDEPVWLEAYCRALEEQHPGVVARMLLYGSKARGDDRPDSDLDV